MVMIIIFLVGGNLNQAESKQEFDQSNNQVSGVKISTDRIVQPYATPTPKSRLIVTSPPPTNTPTATPTVCDNSSCQADGYDTYQDEFLITCYNVPLETEFTSSKISKVVVTNPNTCSTTTESFRSDFLAAVDLNGTGKDDDGQLIAREFFCSGANYRYVSCPTGSCGVCVTAGDSFALGTNRFVCGQSVCIQGYGS